MDRPGGHDAASRPNLRGAGERRRSRSTDMIINGAAYAGPLLALASTSLG
jgi:hypothetical protein